VAADPSSKRVAKASAYPNGKLKSELYDLFLCPGDFWCTNDEFAQDLEDISLAERLGAAECEWYRDADGLQVVCGLDFRDPGIQLVVTRDGFVFKPKPGAAPHVFVSYAHEDARHADQLSMALARAGLRPWIDRRELLVGQNWRRRIEDAIRSSDLFIALLSPRSLSKRGFVQSELRRALEVAEEMPEHNLYILPARIEECEPAQEALKRLHRVDLFPDWDAGVRALIRSVYAARDPQQRP
jgi:TIR domain-containing protein